MTRKVFFLLLTITMLLGTLLRKKRYKFTTNRAVLLAALLVIGGIGGTYLLGFLEDGSWGSISYYGSVFFVPILMLLFSKIIKYNYSVLMDYCAPCGVAAIAVGKFHCKLNGCCAGRVFFQGVSGKEFVFPSQITEMCVAIIILVILLFLEKQDKYIGKLYPFFLILYGSTRFVLNWFRDTDLVFGLIPMASIISLIAIIIGVIWFFLIKKFPVQIQKKEKGKKKNHLQ